MIRDIQDVIECLRQTVRYPLDQNPEYLSAPPTLTSGDYLIRHPLITIDNLRAIAPDFATYDYTGKIQAWNILTNYSVDDIVVFNTVLYQALTANVGQQPDTSPNDWIELDPFYLWLEDQRDQGVRTFMQKVINSKRDKRQTKTLVDNLNLYHKTGRINDLLINKSRLVGFEVEISNPGALIIVVNKIRLQFTDAQTIPIKIFHSSQVDPVYEFDLIYTTQGSAQWLDATDIVLDDRYAGGTWYITYREDLIIGQAVNARYYWDKPPCRTCNNYDYSAYQQFSPFLRVRGFSVDTPTNVMWDIATNKYHPSDTFGLNINFSAKCDLTSFICDNTDLFGEGIAQQLVVTHLLDISNTIRSNTISEKMRELARLALANQDLGGDGEVDKATQIVDDTNFELSDVHDRVCQPCLPSKGVTMKSVSTNHIRHSYAHRRY